MVDSAFLPSVDDIKQKLRDAYSSTADAVCGMPRRPQTVSSEVQLSVPGFAHLQFNVTWDVEELCPR